MGHGEDAEFDVFYVASFDNLVRVLTLTLGDAELAADVVQEAMVKAYARWTRVQRMDNPAGWVFRVASNAARSRARRLWRELLDDRAEPAPAAPPRVQWSGQLDPILAELSPDHRAVLLLRFGLDWSVEATAAALGVSPGTVKSRQSRALTSIRERSEVVTNG